jgi:putative membrane-bound dehydrogenase-like protein
MDVVIGNDRQQITRIWNLEQKRWSEVRTPFRVREAEFGLVQEKTLAIVRGAGAWQFSGGGWTATSALTKASPELPADAALQLRDLDRDGSCELLVSAPAKTAIYSWSDKTTQWETAKFSLPEGVALLNELGEDDGLRFVDLNGDSFDDVLLSNEERFTIHLWNTDVKPHLGWTPGWSELIRAGPRTGAASEPPPIVRAGPHRNNGAWFHNAHLVVQNEDTAKLDAVVDRRSFKELIAFDVPPPKSPEESLRAIRTRDGFAVELVAAEPLIVDPIALEWDARGRLWVVEMRDYPSGVPGKEKGGGVIKLLEDTDGDARYDKATPFLEDIPFPTGVMPWRKGVLVSAAPDIFYAEDKDGDGRADRREVLFTGFKPGNQQHRMNGFEWGLDGWIYGANGDSGGRVKSLRTGRETDISGRDFRFRPDTGEFEAESGQTQYGRRRDDWGHWFGNNNPTWLWHYTIPEHYLRRNPKLAVKSTQKVLANYDASTRVFPISEQPIRFNQPQSLGHVTSACSPAPYRDELFGASFADSVFISEPVHNVVHRENLTPEGATFTSRRAEDEKEREFLASTDVWFRPTMLKTGPDGALYIADMYRFVLEHPEWIAPATQARLDLRAGEDKGRIYRVAPVGAPRRKPVNIEALRTRELVAALDSPNGWQRDTAQRLLYERGDHGAVDPLTQLVRSASNPKVRLQALATLDVLNAASVHAVISALRDPEPLVRAGALRVAERVKASDDTLLYAILALETDPDIRVRHQLAFSLGNFRAPEATAVLTRLAEREGTEPDMRVAILSSVAPDHPLMNTLREAAPNRDKGHAAPVITYNTPDRAKVLANFTGIEKLTGDAQRGQIVFRENCAACHRFKNEGRELGPDLAMVSSKPVDWLLTAIFDPNQAIEPRYQAQHATLKDGAELIGLISAETANNITLRTPDGAEHAVLRTDLQTLRPLGRSLMPEGLESVLKPQSVADLVSFLRAADSPQNP